MLEAIQWYFNENLNLTSESPIATGQFWHPFFSNKRSSFEVQSSSSLGDKRAVRDKQNSGMLLTATWLVCFFSLIRETEGPSNRRCRMEIVSWRQTTCLSQLTISMCVKIGIGSRNVERVTIKRKTLVCSTRRTARRGQRRRERERERERKGKHEKSSAREQ